MDSIAKMTIPCNPDIYELCNIFMAESHLHTHQMPMRLCICICTLERSWWLQSAAEIQAISPVHTDGKCQHTSEQSWLTGCILDANVERRGFTSVKANRDTKACGKSKGGGLILYVTNRWCNPSHVTVKDTLCCCDLELLAVSMRPYYLPREFTHVIAECVYIAPRADAGAACEIIQSSVAQLQTQHSKALFVICGDFNRVFLISLWLPFISLWTVRPTKIGVLTCCLQTSQHPLSHQTVSLTTTLFA